MGHKHPKSEEMAELKGSPVSFSSLVCYDPYLWQAHWRNITTMLCIFHKFSSKKTIYMNLIKLGPKDSQILEVKQVET